MEKRVRSCSDLETMESRAERTGCTQRQMRADRPSKVQSLCESNESTSGIGHLSSVAHQEEVQVIIWE